MPLFIQKPVFWNTSAYIKPSGVRATSGFPAEHGFGHEEWNNSPRLAFRDKGEDYLVFHTEVVGHAPVEQNVGQTFVFMTATHGGRQNLVGVAGNATCLMDNRRFAGEREGLARRLHIYELWKEAWAVPAVRQCHNDDQGAFKKHWDANYTWLPNWLAPRSHYLWFDRPVPIDASMITGKRQFLRMYNSHTVLTRVQAAGIMAMVPASQRDRKWGSISDAIGSAPFQPTTSDELPDDGESITTKLSRIQARRGQGKYRDALISRWGAACAVTGLTTLEILRASHVKPWSVCSNKERLDEHNGLLLSANIDALFDVGLISFADNGDMKISARLTKKDRDSLGLPRPLRHAPSRQLQTYLQHHRKHVFDPIQSAASLTSA